MGQKFRFICRSCDYSVVVAGGPSAGMSSTSLTYRCLNCNILFDRYAKFDLFKKTEDVDIPICSICEKPDVVLWNGENRECPRCASTMDIDEGVYRLNIMKLLACNVAP